MTIAEDRPVKSAAGMEIRARMAAREAAARGEPVTAEIAVPETAAVAIPGQGIDGDVVLNAIRVCLGYMARWPSAEALTAASGYVAASHARAPNEAGCMLPVWQYMPRFFLTSEEGGSGKSWMGRMMLNLCPNGKSLSEPTKAALIQLISEQATIGITELDILLGSRSRNAGIVAIANSGYEPEHIHTRMKGGRAEQIPLFGPMILDGLDVLIKTRRDLRPMFSRCIIAGVKRGEPGYKPPRFDAEARAQFRAVRELCGQWMAQAVADGIGEFVPGLPEGVGNRAAAVWEPLCAVAQWAGGEWPGLMAASCERLEASSGLPPLEAQEQAVRSSTLAKWARAQGMAWGAS